MHVSDDMFGLFRSECNSFFLFTVNVRIMYLSCTVKMSKTTFKLSETSAVLIVFACPLQRPHLYCYPFLPSLYMNLVPEKLYFDQ
jgi:hypothetical protein